MKASDICAQFQPSDAASALLGEHGSEAPADFLKRLAELDTDSIQFIAHALPKRQAVWWACQCARKAYGEKPPEKAVSCLQVTERWIAEPTEPNRQAAKIAADAAELNTPAGSAGLGAFFSDGLGSDPKAQSMTAKAVAASVLLSSTLEQDKDRILNRFRQFVALGVEVVRKTNRQG